MFDNSVAGSDEAVVSLWVSRVSILSLHLLQCITSAAVLAAYVAEFRPKQPVVLLPLADITDVAWPCFGHPDIFGQHALDNLRDFGFLSLILCFKLCNYVQQSGWGAARNLSARIK
jgi:hypothetical protein